MNVIDKASFTLTRFIRDNNIDAASEEVLHYSLSLLINTLSAYILTFIICSLTGHLFQALVVVISYSLLRYTSGGVHLSTSVRCCLYSVTMFTLLAHTNYEFNSHYIGIIITSVTVIILLQTAPRGIKNVSRIDEKYYPLLKTISIVLVLSNLFIHSSILSLAFLVQAIHTSNVGYLFVKYVERLLDFMLRKEVSANEG